MLPRASLSTGSGKNPVQRRELVQCPVHHLYRALKPERKKHIILAGVKKFCAE